MMIQSITVLKKQNSNYKRYLLITVKPLNQYLTNPHFKYQEKENKIYFQRICLPLLLFFFVAVKTLVLMDYKLFSCYSC